LDALERRKILFFQKKVLDWYALHKRDLPWRKTTEPYLILVSETMLQQTQVDRVIPYFKRWMRKWPTFSSLAKAQKRTVLSMWSGLGYNSRALRLQQLAKEVVKRNRGKLPRNEEELLSLPGIGPYTARAVLAFAFNEPVPVVDTNIRRVIIFELGLDKDISLREITRIAGLCVPRGKSCEWHNALMDYGAIVLTSRVTGIEALSKQSKFEGSERQIRGRIVKYLLREKKENVARLKKLFDHEEFNSILNKMEKDGIIVLKGKVVSFH